MSSPSDWMQFYQQQQPSLSNPTSSGDRLPNAVSPAGNTTSNSISTSTPLSPEGRVSKPARKRSRASRRTPTTLLNADITNFRAMVQQFTGGPTARFASEPNPANINFGPAELMVPPGYHLQYQQQQQGHHQQQQQQYMFSLSNPIANMEVSDGFLIEGGSSQDGSRRPSNSENRNTNYMF